MKEKNPLLTLVIGMAMLGAGLYWLFNSVYVTTSFGTMFRFGGFSAPSGMVIVPLIIGVFWWVMKPDSFCAKLVTVLGVVVIVAAIIASVRFEFRGSSLYVYTIMILMIVIGAALSARVLLVGDGSDKKNKKDDKK